MSRDRFETVFFEIARWVTIVVLLVACLFPFYYMVLLSLRSIQAVLLSPGRCAAVGERDRHAGVRKGAALDG